MILSTEKYYIAYFDILGYKSFFDDKDNDICEFLSANIHLAQDIMENPLYNDLFSDLEIKVKCFSDNFMILIPVFISSDGYKEIKALSCLMAAYQLKFLKEYSILIRGSITIGEAYIDNNIVFGDGLINAVTLENEAVFPRIILDRKTIDEKICEALCEYWVSKDEDDVYYVDFFRLIGTSIGFEREYSFDDEITYTKELQKNIINLVSKYGKYNNRVKDIRKIQQTEKNISKYAWLLVKFNDYCELTYPEYKIPYKLTLYYRLMKCEISVEKSTKGKKNYDYER